ncbi:MAG: hypothetical protein ACP5O3_00875 [Candidatus Micrarchaeia archaeon]|jgi:hypothetical protein
MSFYAVLRHALSAYIRNFKLISFFSIPFLVSFPLALVLPNFVSLGSIFLRFGSIRHDLTIFDALLIFAALVFALLLFAFSVVAVNLVIKSQRTLLRLNSRDIEKIEVQTFKLFLVYAAVFAVSFGVNYLLYDFGLHTFLGALFSFALSLSVLFAGQAIVLEDLEARHVFSRSISLLTRKPFYVAGFFGVAVLLLLANDALFLALGTALGEQAMISRYLSIVVNALAILPFLECLKVQIYLSKYSILG